MKLQSDPIQSSDSAPSFKGDRHQETRYARLTNVEDEGGRVPQGTGPENTYSLEKFGLIAFPSSSGESRQTGHGKRAFALRNASRATNLGGNE